MILKLKTLILRLKIWKTRNKQSRVDKVKKIAEYNEYKAVSSAIMSSAKDCLFSIKIRIRSESTIKKLENDGFDVRNTNYNDTYIISWRTIK